MIRLYKSNNIPATLNGQTVQNEKNKLNSMVANSTNPCPNDFKSNLYGAKDVRKQLENDQHGKCIFCESLCKGEVEHYRPKAAVIQNKGGLIQSPAYYKLGYDWNNLTLCCHDCNNKKGNYFPLQNSNDRFDLSKEIPLIINPYNEDPVNHLEFKQHVIFPKMDENGNEDPKGKHTIDYIDLNRNDLKERRRRAFNAFNINRKRQNLSYDEMLKQEKQDAINDGRKPESIEFLGMYENQKYKF